MRTFQRNGCRDAYLSSIPRHTIDLDLPEPERWLNVIAEEDVAARGLAKRARASSVAQMGKTESRCRLRDDRYFAGRLSLDGTMSVAMMSTLYAP